MLITEWNLEEAQKAWFDEGRDEGRNEGRNEGRDEIVAMLESGKSPEEIIKEYRRGGSS